LLVPATVLPCPLNIPINCIFISCNKLSVLA
jgi:hypothetical protein